MEQKEKMEGEEDFKEEEEQNEEAKEDSVACRMTHLTSIASTSCEVFSCFSLSYFRKFFDQHQNADQQLELLPVLQYRGGP